DLVAPDLLEGYRVDAWVNTACPRIAIEDVLQYKNPTLTPPEFEIVLGERTWDAYALDEIRAYRARAGGTGAREARSYGYLTIMRVQPAAMAPGLCRTTEGGLRGDPEALQLRRGPRIVRITSPSRLRERAR